MIHKSTAIYRYVGEITGTYIQEIDKRWSTSAKKVQYVFLGLQSDISNKNQTCHRKKKSEKKKEYQF